MSAADDDAPGSDTTSFRITGELSYLDRNGSEDYFDKKFRERIESKKKRVQQAKLITAIKTPYTATGRIDIEAFDRHVEHQIANGVDGIVVAGTTGEGHLMNWDEHIALIRHAATKYGDQLVIVGNTGSNSTRECIRGTRAGFEAGMHASL